MEAPDFWTDAQVSSAKMKELKSMKDDVAIIDKIDKLYQEIEDYIELGNEEEDQEIVDTVGILIVFCLHPVKSNKLKITSNLTILI